MTSSDIRSRFLEFFKKRGHAIIPSASLITADEKGLTNSTLFNAAGMQPLIPYLLGKPHELGRRLVSVQKCLRTIDIDEVGDAVHATFFEMLGNWSLGDYFKEDAIKWSYEFLTSKEEGLGLDPNRLYITVFKGDANSAKDTESADIWKKTGIPEHRIYFEDAASNWWPPVKRENNWTGPTGPSSEMFYDITEKGLGDLSPEQFEKANEEQKVVEIWNDVFMEFNKNEGKIVGKLTERNIDTGAGFERLVMVMQKVDNIYDTDLLKPVMEKIKEYSKNWNLRSARIVADHIRASVFLIADGVTSSNTDRGYVLRRLLRRAIYYATTLEMKNSESGTLAKITDSIRQGYIGTYKNLEEHKEFINKEITTEEISFRNTLHHGEAELVKILDRTLKANNPNTSLKVSGKDIFLLFSTYGFPLEMTREFASRYKVGIDEDGFATEFKKHQALSRSGAEQKFKGGLADEHDPMVVRYHTATHLLHQALHDVLGDSVMQKGSNITAERLRFDFTHGSKMTDEEKKKVEDIVDEKIQAAMPMNKIVMPKAEAEKTGARHSFGEKYGDQVSIYFIGNDLNSAYSKEFCGGPHVTNTKELAGPEGKWRFKIVKEEAVSQGVRRIRAVLE